MKYNEMGTDDGRCCAIKPQTITIWKQSIPGAKQRQNETQGVQCLV